MLNNLLEIVKPNITALAYVERYGGLVQVATQRTEISEGRYIDKKFPVACGVTAQQCWEQGKFQDLIPNSAYRSVFYWEDLTGLQFQEYVGPKKNGLKFRANIRLVGWLNLALLGQNNVCSISGAIAAEIIGAVQGAYTLTAPFVNASARLEALKIPPKTATIFSNYSYGPEIMNLLLGLYDFVAVDFNVEILIPVKCVDAFVVGAPVDCIDLTQN